jgi:hypothetical protein
MAALAMTRDRAGGPPPGPSACRQGGAIPPATRPAGSATQPAGEWPGPVAAPERLRGWAQDARRGDTMVYATREHLPVGSAGAAEARRLAAAGLVELFQRRMPGQSVFAFVARRTGRGWPREAAPLPDARIAAAEVPSAALDAIYQALARAARFGRPCPTDAALALGAGVDRATARDALAVLADAGAITIRCVRAPTLRRVTIALTGATTGLVRSGER